MIILRLWGGLGNQLFQYAYGYTVAKKIGTEMKLDTSYFKKHDLRKPDILSLNLTYNEIVNEGNLPRGIKLFNSKNINRIIRIPNKTIIRIGDHFHYFKETRFKYELFIKEYDIDNSYLDGYWQCQDYFIERRNELFEQFTLKNKSSDELQGLMLKMKNHESVAIHIRRGDYVNNRNIFSNLYLLSKIYYDKCIHDAHKTLSNPYFFFFSNDIEWARQEFGFMPNSCIVSGEYGCSDIEELFLISSCRHQIISNSTFSWWGAWLNQYPNKKVWAPQRWFGNRDILPQEWLKIEVG